ncbi:MAG: pyridoxal-phosphate dependent enzyme [Anaerolineae bacterium]|nr:pyridoxal-phosphate dependent enzyme [Anaerolineae bacterium]
MSANPLPPQCEKCESQWFDAVYDYAKAAELWRAGLADRDTTLWRYGELRPITDEDAILSMGEGWTPLLRAKSLGEELGHEHIFIKDERMSPTGSFKDRQGTLTISYLRQRGIRECVMASTGNKAAAYAAFCARAHIRLWVFLTSTVPSEKLRELALYGAEVVKIAGTYDQAKKVAMDFAARRNLYYDRGAESLAGREGFKTIAYELAEQLARQMPPDEKGKWRVPDWYIQAVSGGIGPLGIWKGFQELKEMGLTDKMPKLAIVQSEGCAPMAAAWRFRLEKADPVVPHTRITVLATGNPGRSYTLLREACLETEGTMIAVSDGEAFRAMRRMARIEGISMEPAAAVAFAGLEKLVADDVIKKDETVIVNCSGHTFPAEKHILEDQYVLDLEFGEDDASATHKQLEEGLGAAFARLDEQVTTVVVIDDNPQDSRLIRRLLQAHKNYRVFEVNNPLDGLDIVRQRKPDLVVCDLTMPDMDGFTLLEALKTDAETTDIPVVVVSAKTLTPGDRTRLEQHAESLWQKGSFNTRELVEHVVKTLGGDLQDSPEELTEVTNGKVVAASKKAIVQDAPPPDKVRDVVVIDDEHRDARLIRRLLEATGRYNVLEAFDGESGWDLIKTKKPSLIVLDLMLPDMTGEALLERLKNDDDTKDIPVVVLTAKDIRAAEREQLLGKIISLFEKANLDRQALVDYVNETLSDD